MIILIFLAASAAAALAGWAMFALTHPMAGGQGIVIFPCKAAGVMALVTSLGSWIGRGGFQAVPRHCC